MTDVTATCFTNGPGTRPICLGSLAVVVVATMVEALLPLALE